MNQRIELPEPITWATFRAIQSADDVDWRPTSELVRLVTVAEILIEKDPVRARSEGEFAFRRGYEHVRDALDERAPRRSW